MIYFFYLSWPQGGAERGLHQLASTRQAIRKGKDAHWHT